MTNEELKALANALIEATDRLSEDERSNELGDAWNIANDRYVEASEPKVVLGLIADNEHLALCARQWEEAAMQWIAERDALKAECEGLRKALSECATSLEGEMLQKFHGQKPDDMHPVTRREYDRDMEELAGYRAVAGGVEVRLDTPDELAALRKDAERYRWLKPNAVVMLRMTPSYVAANGQLVHTCYPSQEELDASIDAAMRKGGQSNA